jgi:hypothetical protein
MANHYPAYDPSDPLMRCYQVALRSHASEPQQTFSTPLSTSVTALATSMSQDDIHKRFWIAAMNGDTSAMQQEFHHMISVARSRDQDCLFLKQQHKQEVEANHGEMDWMRRRILDLEDEVRRMKGRSGG